MRTIHKYQIPFGDEVAIHMPKDTSILKFSIQKIINGSPDICVWAIIDTESEMEERRFRIHCTEQPLPDNSTAHGSNTVSDWDYEYFDTLTDRQFVWHVFVGYK